MTKKIIFIANNNLGNGLSGGDRIFLEFLKNWQNKSDITVFAAQETINLIHLHHIKKIKIIPTDTKLNKTNYFDNLQLIKHNFKRTYLGLKNIWQHRQILKKTNYIYSVSDFYPDFFPALFAKLLHPKTKLIIGYYLFAPNPFLLKSPYKQTNFTKGLLYWLIQQPTHLLTNIFADVVFLTSKPDQKKFPHKKTIIVQGGVDIRPAQQYFKSKIIIPKIYDAVFIGRLHPQKGILELINIWKIVTKTEPSAKLIIIGDGELKERVFQQIKKLKLNKNIKMTGFLDGKEKYKIFKQSKIVVHPATYDSGGMAAAEAMAWGLPGVSYDLEALKTYYPKGMIKTPCFDQKLFSQNINKLLKNKKTYDLISTQALRLIREKWDWQIRAQNIYIQIFKK